MVVPQSYMRIPIRAQALHLFPPRRNGIAFHLERIVLPDPFDELQQVFPLPTVLFRKESAFARKCEWPSLALNNSFVARLLLTDINTVRPRSLDTYRSRPPLAPDGG